MKQRHVLLRSLFYSILVLLSIQSSIISCWKHSIRLGAGCPSGSDRIYKGGSQRILVRGYLSKKFELNCGVSHGSCLGPLLFTIYTSSLLEVVEKYLPSVHCYADDTQLYVSFHPADETDETGHLDAITAVNCCIKAIGCWMRENKLFLNEEKTQFLLIGTKQQLAKVDNRHIKVGKVNIAPHSPVKNLGVWFDSNLSMIDHVTKTCSAAFYYLCNIRRIRKYLTK